MRPFRPADFIERAGVYLLACVGGCIDAIGFLTLGSLFVAHMSGNTASLGAFFGHGQWALGLPHLLALPIFILGILLGHLWLAWRPGSGTVARILLCEAVLLMGFGIAWGLAGNPALNTPAFYAFASMPLLAMGLQNSSIRTIGNVTFHTTYVTGVVDLFAESSAKYLRNRSPDAAKTARQAALVWLCYAGGGAIGSAGLLFLKAGIFALPVAILLMLACLLWLRDRQPSGRGT